MNFINQVILGETVKETKKLPDESFDFCFADPPYFLQLPKNKKLLRVEGTEYDGCKDKWDSFPSFDKYKKFTKNWLKEIHRLLKKDGSICVISGMQSIYEIGNILRELGFWVINDIVWLKSNPTPNFSGSRLNNSHETIIWASKSKQSKFTFNYKTGKLLNNGKQMGSVWTFPVCSGNERLKDSDGNKLHSTQKPIALIKRIINLFTRPNDLVIDPFGGTMTTAVACKMTNRRYTMIEMDEKYVKYGIKRINSTLNEVNDINNATADIKPIKVSFKEMVENNIFKINEPFVHKNGKQALLANEKGYLTFENKTVSMHDMAGLLSNKTNRLNGFDYFSVYRNGKLVSINELRNQYRKQVEANK